ncbi:transposase [Thermosulfurimonas sp. F29]|uniref:transposase n=1 Tax=Thermosulfurimonas sp. F29 TaxID=2867247 RepID=UPI002103B5C8|nr:transposase [Thermosulfurimonas sp. F29]
MYKESHNQLTFGEYLLYQNLPDDILAYLNRIIDWKPFELILAKLHPSSVGRPAYNPLLMLKILIIQQIYKHSDTEVEVMLYGNLFSAASVSPLPTPSPITPPSPASVTTSSP